MTLGIARHLEEGARGGTRGSPTLSRGAQDYEP